MSQDRHSFRKLLPGFVIPAGTQVVLKVAKARLHWYLRRLLEQVEFKEKGTYKPKHAMHLIRLLHSGIAALQTGEIRVDVAERRDELLRIRSGSLGFEEVKRRALELDEQFEEAFEPTSLPEQPDYQRVDDFLIRARRRMVDG